MKPESYLPLYKSEIKKYYGEMWCLVQNIICYLIVKIILIMNRIAKTTFFKHYPKLRNLISSQTIRGDSKNIFVPFPSFSNFSNISYIQNQTKYSFSSTNEPVDYRKKIVTLIKEDKYNTDEFRNTMELAFQKSMSIKIKIRQNYPKLPIF